MYVYSNYIFFNVLSKGIPGDKMIQMECQLLLSKRIQSEITKYTASSHCCLAVKLGLIFTPTNEKMHRLNLIQLLQKPINTIIHVDSGSQQSGIEIFSSTRRHQSKVSLPYW